jgi:hypothetical protein
MADECSGPVTGLEEIETGNYGRVKSNMRTEWQFVFDPNPSSEYPGSNLKSGVRVGKAMLDQHGNQLLDHQGNPRFWPCRVPVSVQSFLNHPVAERAKLRKPEIVGLRLYTGPAYSKLNSLLRMGKQHIMEKRQQGENTYTVTISAINSGIRKLAQCTQVEPDNLVLYRGTCNMKMPEHVLDSSFVECGFSSATPRREVVYSCVFLCDMRVCVWGGGVFVYYTALCTEFS